MDISNKLLDLKEETLNFGDIVNQAENPADKDFRYACDLFSKHLSYQLRSISSNISIKEANPEIQQTATQLNVLSELITPCTTDNKMSDTWSDKLLNFCSQLKTLKNIAA